MDIINGTRLRVWNQQPEAFFEEAFLDADGTIAPSDGWCKQGVDLAERTAPLKAVGAPDGNRNAVAKEPVDDLPLMKSARENNSNNIRVVSGKRQGPNAERLTARIARDRPDILERMKAGEFRSVRQAALEAEIVTPTISIPLDPDRAVRLLVKHFRDEDLIALIRGLANWAGVQILEP